MNLKKHIALNLPRFLKAKVFFRLKPRHLTFEVTNVCNLKCPLCPTTIQTREKGFLKFENFKKVIDEVKHEIKSISFYILGEPLLNKELFDMVKYANSLGIETSFSTNNELIKKYLDDIFDSGLSKIQVVLDGLNKEDHERYRVGGNFENSLESIRLLSERKKELNSVKPYIHLQTLLFKYNVGKEGEFKEVATKLGVDGISIKKITLGRDEAKEKKYKDEFLPEEKSMQRFGSLLYKNAKVCPQIIRTATVLWNGDLVACCYDSNGRDVLGNVVKDGFWNVFYGKQRKSSIKNIIYHTNKICANCDGAE